MVGIRTGLVLALITMVTSEMIARQSGVGNILFNSLDMALYDTVYAMIVVIGILGFVLDVAFEKLRCLARCLGRAGAPDRGRARHDGASAQPSSLIGALPIALLLALWHGLAASGMAPPSLLPAPMAVFARLAEQLGDPTFLEHAAMTLFRLFAGFAIAVVVGVAVGVAAAGNRTIEALVKPVVRVLAPVPKIALYPAFMLILGLRACLQDRAGGGRRACSRSCSPPIRARAPSSRSSCGRRGRPARRARRAACSRSCCRRRCHPS